MTDRFSHDNSTGDPPCNVEHGLYCGGTWKGIKNQLDYIQGMGFDAVWISPITEQLPQLTGVGESYAGYWQQNLGGINERFGSEDDLRNLIDEMHERDMYVMLDVVVNHVGYAGPGPNMNQEVIQPFNQRKYYHDYCDIHEPGNQTENEVCWLGDIWVSLADLRTEDDEVREMLGQWIQDTVSNYSIDGLRIDTAINVESDFFRGFVESAGVFATGEVLHGDVRVACQWEETIGSILNYPVYYPLIRAFQDNKGSINDLVSTIESSKEWCKDPTAMGSFSENHDVPRFANHTHDMALAKNILTFNFMADGIPIVFQGQEQHMNGGDSPHYNRSPVWGTKFDMSAPLYKHISTINTLRHHVISTSRNYTDYGNYVIYQDMHTLAMRKGFEGAQVLTLLTNNGEDGPYYTQSLTDHGHAPGTPITEIITCTNLTVNGSGHLNVDMAAGEPRILYPTQLLYNSSLCGLPDTAPPGATALAQTTLVTHMPVTHHGHTFATPLSTVVPMLYPLNVTEVPAPSGPTYSSHPWPTFTGYASTTNTGDQGEPTGTINLSDTLADDTATATAPTATGDGFIGQSGAGERGSPHRAVAMLAAAGCIALAECLEG
ncbi:hypothetical protein MBLNU230_g4613t2 [Neophaeotheca triangularis]